MSNIRAPRTLVMVALLGSALGLACAPEQPHLDMCQELANAPATPAPSVDGGLVYELYVRSFQDSDGDGVGDLDGVRARLDYLEWLGVDTVWMMPTFPAGGPAGYDVEDFEGVEADYGDEDDMAELLAEAAARGLRVLLDVPINHTASSHPWFLDATADEDSAQRARYLFSHEQWDELRWYPADDGGWYYAFFGEGFPDLDWSSPDVATDMVDAMNGWLDQGVGGFRLDAVRQLVEDDGAISDTDEGHCTLAWLAASLSQDHDPLLLSEAWADDLEITLDYLGSEERPETDLVTSVSRLWATGTAYERGDRTVLGELLRQEADAGVSERMAAIVGTHDLSRFRDRVPDEAMRRGWMVLLFTLPGTPMLYYGEEIDLRDASESTGQDLTWRAPMAWNAEAWGGFTTGTPWMQPSAEYTEGVNVIDAWDDEWSMLRLVRGLAQLRQGSEVLRQGALELVEVEAPSLLVFKRTWEDEAVLVIVNFADAEVFGLELEGLTDKGWVDLTLGRPAPNDRLDIEAWGYRVLATESLSEHTVPGLPR